LLEIAPRIPTTFRAAPSGQAFIDWLISSEGQKAIADYKINGDQLFFPNADDPSA
jgi:tungstate transport system substrate-binding protein